MRTSILLFVGLAEVLACSSAGPAATPAGAFTGPPYVTSTSMSGCFAIEVRTSPQPPTHGNLSAQLTVRDPASGAPIDGLTVTVVPFMPSMGHGTSVTPAVDPAGAGRYTVTNLALFMPGHWELRTQIAGACTDTATPAIDVP